MYNWTQQLFSLKNESFVIEIKISYQHNLNSSWDSVNITVTRLWAGGSGIWIPARATYLFLQKHPDHEWDPPSLLVNRYQGYFLEVKQPRCEAAHSPTSSAEVQDKWSHLYSLFVLSFHGQGQLFFTLSLHKFNMFHHFHSTLKQLQLCFKFTINSVCWTYLNAVELN